MPKIAEFFGILIYMYFNDHNPPHFHAVYGGDKALVAIDDFRIIRGHLPPRVHGLVVEWAAQHKDELLQNWNNAIKLHPLAKIEPLR